MTILAIAGCLLFGTCTLGLSIVGLGPNVGLSFGYYGILNDIKSKADSIPGVEIVRVRANYEISEVEEFSLDVVVDGTWGSSIYFPDRGYEERVAILRQWEKTTLPSLRGSGEAPEP